VPGWRAPPTTPTPPPPATLSWQGYGCERAEDCGVTPDQVVNTWPVEQLLEWTGRNR